MFVVHDKGNQVLLKGSYTQVLSTRTPQFRVGLQSHETNYKAIFLLLMLRFESAHV